MGLVGCRNSGSFSAAVHVRFHVICSWVVDSVFMCPSSKTDSETTHYRICVCRGRSLALHGSSYTLGTSYENRPSFVDKRTSWTEVLVLFVCVVVPLHCTACRVNLNPRYHTTLGYFRTVLFVRRTLLSARRCVNGGFPSLDWRKVLFRLHRVFKCCKYKGLGTVHYVVLAF